MVPASGTRARVELFTWFGMMKFHFVRHGESANNARGHHDDCIVSSDASSAKSGGRQPDPCLTAKGLAQAEAVAAFLAAKAPPSAILTSAMTRALMTARAIADKVPTATSYVWPMLCEQGGLFAGERSDKGSGQLPVHGLSLNRIKQLLPDALADDSDFIHGVDRGWWKGGYESPEESVERAKAVAARLFRTASDATVGASGSGSEDDSVVVITHGLFFDSLLKVLLHMDPSASCPAFFLSGNCAMATIHLKPNTEPRGSNSSGSLGRVFVSGLNSQDFLTKELRSGHRMGGLRVAAPPSPSLICAPSTGGAGAGAGAPAGTERATKRQRTNGTATLASGSGIHVVAGCVEAKLVVVLRTDLKMGKGKLCAQMSHATVGVLAKCARAVPTDVEVWEAGGSPTIALKVPSELELDTILSSARDAGLPVHVVFDAGRTQVQAGTATCAAIGPACCERVDAVTGNLKLL